MEEHMRELTVVRWNLGEGDEKTYEFEDEAILEVLDGGNVHVLDMEDGTAVAYFGGVQEARWTS
jgi:hypothetical protein